MTAPVTVMMTTQVDTSRSLSSSYDNSYTDGTNDNEVSFSIASEATSVSTADELMSSVKQTITSYGTCTTNVNIVSRLLLLLISMHYYTSIHSLTIYFEVNFVLHSVHYLHFMEPLFRYYHFGDVYSCHLSLMNIFTSRECVVVRKWVQSPEWGFPLIVWLFP